MSDDQSQGSVLAITPQDEPVKPAKTKWFSSFRVEVLPTWLIRLAVFALVVVLAYRAATVQLNFTDLRVVDLLSLLLGLFAVVLSAMFYFKATDTSNRFYDNTYHFTKDISEKIGRLEERFGQAMEHLHEGYTGIQRRFEQLPFVGGDVEKMKKELEEAKQTIETKEEEKTKVIENLTLRAQLGEQERTEILKILQDKEVELIKAREDSRRLQSQIKHRERTVDPAGSEVIHNMLVDVLLSLPSSLLQKPFRYISSEMPALLTPHQHRYLRDLGLIEDGHLTATGHHLLRRSYDAIQRRTTTTTPPPSP